MKKILCYIDSMQMGGAQRVMANLTKHFVDSNVSVILVNDIVPIDGVPEYEIDNKVKRIFLDQEKKKATGLRKNIYRIFAIRKLVKKEAPDVVLSFIGPPNIRMLLGTFGLRTRKIVSVRNDPYKEYGSGKKKAFAKCVFNLADGCVFQTNDAAKYFSGKLQKKSTVIFNPVKDSFYRVERKPDESTIIMVGRLNRQKNYHMAIEGFSIISEQYPNICLKIYGEGELRQDIQGEINEMALSHRVELMGRTNDVEKKLSTAMLYLLTSDYEGMPNALMEAMAAGVPVVATNCPCGGPRELIHSKNEGILIRVNDSKELADKLRELIENRELRLKLGENAKKRANEFLPEHIMKQWDNYLFDYQA